MNNTNNSIISDELKEKIQNAVREERIRRDQEKKDKEEKELKRISTIKKDVLEIIASIPQIIKENPGEDKFILVNKVGNFYKSGFYLPSNFWASKDSANLTGIEKLIFEECVNLGFEVISITEELEEYDGHGNKQYSSHFGIRIKF